MMRRTFYFTALLVIVLMAGPIGAQSPPTVLNDYVLGGTGGRIEHVNQMNAGLNLTIPLVRVRGRGIDFSYVLNYSSRIWYTEQVGFPPEIPYQDYWRYRAPWGVNGSNAGAIGGTLLVDTCETPNGTEEIWVTDMNISASFKDGSGKQFPTAEMIMPGCYSPAPYSNYLETYSSELPSVFFQRNYFVVKAPDGSRPDTADPNGNYQDAVGNTFYDSVGRAVLTVTSTSGYPTQLTLADGRIIGLVWTDISATTSFPYGVNCANCPLKVLTQINLPNGRGWTFEYASNSYGQLTKIILPTGGYIRYTHALLNFEVDGLQVHGVTGRYESPDGLVENGWTYSYANVNGWIESTVADPNGDVTFTRFDGRNEIDVEKRQGATQVLTKTHQDWICDTIPQSTAADIGWVAVILSPGNCRVSDVTTTIYDGASSKTKKIHYDYDQSLSYTYPANTTIYPQSFGPPPTNYTASYGNVTGILEYDWGDGSTPGPLVRQTENTYLTANPANGWINYLDPSVHIVNKLALQVVKDGQGNILAKTEYEYDGSTLSSTTGVPKHDYSTHPASNRKRGNLTKTKRWRNTDGAWLATNNTYNDLGNLLTTTDPGGHTTNFSYADDYSDSIDRNSQAYLTQIASPPTEGINHIERKRYHYQTGLLYQSIDKNSQTTTFVYDNMNRVASVTYPDTGQTNYSFNDPAFPPKLTTTTKITSTSNFVSETEYDGLGRARKAKQISGGPIYTRTQYDANGRKWKIWNPTTCDPDVYPTSCPGETTFGITEYNYDSLDRVTRLIPQDGTASSNNVTTAYSLSVGTPGRTVVTVTDQAGKQRKSYTDALGRLIQVDEPNPTLATPAVTTYTYDTLDNLTTVTQSGSRQRTFTYNSLSQLLTATNPESGTITYTYDNDGNLYQKTDARGITATHSYDALHRLTLKSYNDTPQTPSASYTYDVSSFYGHTVTNPVGRLVHSSNLINSNATFSYDSMGRIKDQWSLLPSYVEVLTSAQYDLAGNMTRLKYPSTREVVFGYDTASRLTQVNLDKWSGATVNYNYLSPTADMYHPHGAPKAWTLGSGFVETNTYNNRLQPVSMTGVKSPTTAFSKTYSFNHGTANNGNVASITDNLNAGRTQTFTYDELNRLDVAYTQATSGNDCWGLDHGYDQWANLLTIVKKSTHAPCTVGTLSQTALATNRISGIPYDAAGNQTGDGTGGVTYQWDAESRMKSLNATGATYTYDANGMRVRKQSSTETTEYVYFGGHPIAERNAGAGTWTDYVFAGGLRLAQASVEPDNPGFENGWTSWWNWGGTLVTDATKAHSGSNYMQLATAGPHVVVMNSEVIPVVPGEAITFGGWAYRELGTGGLLHWVLAVYNSSDVAIAYPSTADVSAPQWTYNQTTYTMPAGAAYIRLYVQVYLAPGAVTARFDDGFVLAGTRYYHGDHLGSSRLMTNALGAVTWEATYLPFGIEHNPQATTNHYKFSGKERDTESGLDYFGARFNSSTLGRFLSPDPFLRSGRVESPQSWNRYPYVLNNPINATDPNGLDCVYTDDFNETGEVTVVRGDCQSERGNGIYVDGTIDISSIDYNSKTNELGFSFTNAEKETGGAGTISLGPPMESDLLNANAIAIFSDINRRNIVGNTLKMYGAGAVIGLTGGAACSYLCPSAGLTTLGLAGAGGTAAAGAGVTAATVSAALNQLLGLLAEGKVAEATAYCIALASTPQGQALLRAMHHVTARLLSELSGRGATELVWRLMNAQDMTGKFLR